MSSLLRPLIQLSIRELKCPHSSRYCTNIPLAQLSHLKGPSYSGLHKASSSHHHSPRYTISAYHRQFALSNGHPHCCDMVDQRGIQLSATRTILAVITT